MQIEDLVERLGLVAHPEGGWYREIYRNAAVSTIHYVLPAGGLAPLHRVRERVELWHFLGGAPVELHTIDDGNRHAVVALGPDAPVGVVPPGAWQATRASAGGGAWLGCTVAPAFDFAAWEMPPRAELVGALPAALHAIVRELTRA
ncbi:MAG TPA: cupin domain-containing protein [Polyangia bacterium]